MHGAGLLFVSAVAGYWVLERAETHKPGMLRAAGRFLGWFIILASIAGATSDLCSGGFGRRGMKGLCPFPHMGPGPSAPGQP